MSNTEEFSPPPNDHCDLRLSTNDRQFSVIELDSYGFQLTTANAEEWLTEELQEGVLELGNSHQLAVHFRLRRRTATGYRCSLHDMSLAEQSTLDEMVQELSRSRTEDELQGLSYDQIAAGDADSATRAVKNGNKPARSKSALVGILMVAAMIVIAAVVAMMVKGRSSLELHNGTLAGNYIPLSADMDCEVAELHVKVGDVVTAGQPLYRLVSRERDAERERVRAELDTAISEHRATQRQVADYSKQMEVASLALEGRISIVEAEMAQTKGEFAYAAKQVERLRPLARSGAVKPVEYDAAVEIRDSHAREKTVKEAMLNQLQISKDALARGIIIDESGALDDRKSELENRLAISDAKVSEARKLMAQIESLADPASVVAPTDGTVYSLYRNKGEFVRSGDPIISLSGAEASWAIGHIDAQFATKVHPGQKVFVNIPSVGVRAEGRVVSVGHRGLYAQGDWSADFRATLPTDVPIKVQLPDIPVELPSGIRLDMVVTLEKVWPWQKKTIDVAWDRGSDQQRAGSELPLVIPQPTQATIVHEPIQ